MKVGFNLKFRSKFSFTFTCHGCLYCAILKSFIWFWGKKGPRGRFIFQDVPKLHEFTIAIIEGYSNYWRRLMVWNITSISRLTLTFHLQLVLHPCDSFLITNRNMAGPSVKKNTVSLRWMQFTNENWIQNVFLTFRTVTYCFHIEHLSYLIHSPICHI